MSASLPVDDLSTSSFDDPVPAGSESSISNASDSGVSPHAFELDIHRILQRLPGVIVDRLVVRRAGDGSVLLEGTVQVTSESPSDFADPIRRHTGVENVIDRLRVRRTSALDETRLN